MTAASTRPARRVQPRAWIISIGTELTLGHRVDTNGPWLARQLGGCGLRCVRQVIVPDELPAIRELLWEGAQACELIVLTGGLGPTADDLTRQALADAAGVPLDFDVVSAERIRARFTERGQEMPPANRVQAFVPRTGSLLPNTCGTAPGVFVRLGRTPCYALPGVPFEMRAMFTREVLPQLREAGGNWVLRSRRLLCFGLSEAEIGARLSSLMQPGRNPSVGTTAESGIISVRLTVQAVSPAAANKALSETEAEIQTRLGAAVFGREHDTLAAVVGTRLAERGETLSTAESCTGGLIAKLLTDVPGSSGYFVGGAVTYSNELKQDLLGVPAQVLAEFGAVSEPVARAMADGARKRFGTTYALGVTGIAGPAGSTPDKPVGLVFIALATPQGATSRELRFGSDGPRDLIRTRAACTALNMLRLTVG